MCIIYAAFYNNVIRCRDLHQPVYAVIFIAVACAVVCLRVILLRLYLPDDVPVCVIPDAFCTAVGIMDSDALVICVIFIADSRSVFCLSS